MRYGVALLAVAAALLVRLLFLDRLGETAPYLTFLAAVGVAAWFGGVGPAILASGASLVAAEVFVLRSPGLLQAVATPPLLVQTSGFLLVSGMFAFFAAALQQQRKRLHHAETSQRLRRSLEGLGPASRKHELEALQRAEKLAATGRLAVTIAHEIANPLEAVTNLLYLVRSDATVPEPARAYLQMADAELGRVAEITKQTLGFHRDASGPARVDILPLVEGVLSLYGRRLETKHVTVRQSVQAAAVEGQAGELRQVIANLMVNAIDAVAEGGTLALRVHAGHDWRDRRPCVRLLVADNGPGIAPQIGNHIFEPFFTTKRDVGTGLGLWVVRSIVDKHGGRVRMRSRTTGGRRGASFLVTLPAAAPAGP